MKIVLHGRSEKRKIDGHKQYIACEDVECQCCRCRCRCCCHKRVYGLSLEQICDAECSETERARWREILNSTLAETTTQQWNDDDDYDVEIKKNEATIVMFIRYTNFAIQRRETKSNTNGDTCRHANTRTMRAREHKLNGNGNNANHV